MVIHNDNDINLSDQSERVVMLNTKDYEDNMQSYEQKIAEGKAKKIIVEWEEEMYEMVRIGHDLDIMMRPKPFVMCSATYFKNAIDIPHRHVTGTTTTTDKQNTKHGV